MEKVEHPGSRLAWLDTLRVMAGVSILMMHAASGPDGQPFPGIEPDGRTLTVILNTVFYTARTELFMCISLFVLLRSQDRKPLPYGETTASYARRLLVPFVFWVCVYAAGNMFKAWNLNYSQYLWRDWKYTEEWLGYFLLGDVKLHMHFLPTLFALVLMYPVYRIAIRYPWLGLLAIPLILGRHELNLYVYGNFYEDETAVQYLIRASRIVTCTAYGFVAAACWGILKQAPALWIRRTILWTMTVGFVALASIKVMQAMAIIETGNWQYNYPNAWVANLAMPAMLFVIVMLAPIPWPTWISRIAPYSFGIYLVHPLALDICLLVVGKEVSNPSLYVVSKMAFTLAFSVALTVFLSRQKYLAWMVGLGAMHSAKAKAKSADRQGPLVGAPTGTATQTA